MCLGPWSLDGLASCIFGFEELLNISVASFTEINAHGSLGDPLAMIALYRTQNVFGTSTSCAIIS
jgi:hypothetical protein